MQKAALDELIDPSGEIIRHRVGVGGLGNVEDQLRFLKLEAHLI